MSERLTDERLACIEAIGQWAREHDMCIELPHDDVEAMAKELRSLRAAALTSEDAVNLRRLVDVIRGYHERNGHAPTSTTMDLCAALDRVIAEHPTGADQ